MLACFLEAQRKVAIKDVTVPKLAPGDILVRMEASGICGTDLEKIEGQLGPGGILGHEVSGTIEKVADNITDYKPDRKSTRLNSSHVAISYAVFCLKKKTE